MLYKLITLRQERDELTASLLKGNTAILVLWILSEGPAAGDSIASEINRRCENVLEFKHGTLYPLLHQLERDRLIASQWETREDKRPLRVYRLTNDGTVDGRSSQGGQNYTMNEYLRAYYPGRKRLKSTSLSRSPSPPASVRKR